MDEKLDLVEILKDCPKGKVLYSPMFGEVLFNMIDEQCSVYPIDVTCIENRTVYSFCKDGRYIPDAPNGECLLFPSKEERDWSKFKVKKPKFDPKTLRPYDRILVRDFEENPWLCGLFSCIMFEKVFTTCRWEYAIPYNEETKHLAGTSEDAPEYYRYWED